jgi:hypothetical protein
MSHEIDTIPLDAVNIKGGTQSRVELNQTTIAEYVELIRAAIELPPVVTFFDGSTFWLADGFHRFNAHLDAGAMEIASEIRTGTQRDAILYSVGANAAHGLRRTNEDKRRAVMTLLNDPEWSTWSDNAIARACGVSDKTVSNHRPAIFGNSEDATATASTRVVERGGKTYVQNTANIGKAKPTEVMPVTESAELPTPSASGATSPTARMEPPEELAQASNGELQALRDKVEELAEALKSTLADNEMMGRVFDADDQLKAAMDEAKRQKAIAENAERTLASKSGEYVARVAQVTHWMNRAQKAEKTLAKLGAAK